MNGKQLARRLATVFVVAAGLGCAFTGIAEARSAPPSLGRAAVPAEASCFDPGNGTVRQKNCSGVRGYEIPLIIDAGGYKSVTVRGYGALANAGRCRTVGYNGTNVYVSPWKGLTLGNFLVAFSGQADNVYAPADGNLAIECELNAGTDLNYVFHTP